MSDPTQAPDPTAPDPTAPATPDNVPPADVTPSPSQPETTPGAPAPLPVGDPVAPGPLPTTAPAGATPPETSPSQDQRIAELEAQIETLKAAGAQAAPVPVADPPKVGDLVAFTYDDALDGTSTRYGVVRTLENDENGHPNRAQVLWFSGLSGPLDLSLLERQA